VSEESVAAAREVAAQAREAVRRACAGGVVIALPALPGPPPRRDAPQDTLHAFEDRVLQLTALAALSGAPQVREYGFD
jgi:Asp-tRNA(Asn)/Glu-tRNA(Gln) amidotransferase A subunit family amidase